MNKSTKATTPISRAFSEVFGGDSGVLLSYNYPKGLSGEFLSNDLDKNKLISLSAYIFSLKVSLVLISKISRNSYDNSEYADFISDVLTKWSHAALTDDELLFLNKVSPKIIKDNHILNDWILYPFDDNLSGVQTKILIEKDNLKSDSIWLEASSDKTDVGIDWLRKLILYYLIERKENQVFFEKIIQRALSKHQEFYNKCIEYGAVDLFKNNITSFVDKYEKEKDQNYVKINTDLLSETLSFILLSKTKFKRFLRDAFISATLKDNYHKSGLKFSLSNEIEKISLSHEQSLSSAFNEDGLLQSLEIFKPSTIYPNIVDEIKDIDTDKLNIFKKSNDINRLILELLNSNYIKESTNSIDWGLFSFMGAEINTLRSFFSQPIPKRILITGHVGSGKSSLIQNLASDIDKDILNISKPDKRQTTITPILTVSKSLKNINKHHDLLNNPIVLLDNMDEQLKLNKPFIFDYFLSSKKNLKSTEVWTLQDPSSIGSSALESFDYVINLKTPALVFRTKIANYYIEDKDVALKISQVCTTPGTIKKVADWIKSMPGASWNQISSYINSFNDLRGSISENKESLPVEIYSLKEDGGFETFIGSPKAVEKAKQAIVCLKNPELVKKMGGTPPKGLLLKGGPGLGKTHLARAMAVESGVPFLLADCAAMAKDPSLIANVFEFARRHSPCILFLDELDAIGTSAKNNFSAPDPDRQAILNRLLMELDGIASLDGVLVIGATHRSEFLDDALLRSGRLGWHITLSEPDFNSRKNLWEYYLKGKPILDVDIKRLAKISTGFSPADISHASNSALLFSLSHGQDKITQKNIINAIDEVLYGSVDKDVHVIEDERKRVAIHESGHAFLSWFFKRDIDRVSVKPTSFSMGHVRSVRDDGMHGYTLDELLENIVIIYGGLCAEEVFYQNSSTGSENDLDKIRKTLRIMIRDEGMSVDFPSGVGYSMCLPISNDSLIKTESIENKLSLELKELALKLLSNNKEKINNLSKILLNEYELDGQRVDELLGDDKFSFSNKEYHGDFDKIKAILKNRNY